MRQITGQHTYDITKLLQGLVSRGILLQDGQGRWTQYYLQPEANSIHKDNHSVHKGSHSVHKGSHSVHKEDYLMFLGDLPKEQWDRLVEIAKPAAINKRLSPIEMETIILRLCREHWLTRMQIGVLVNRNPDGIRSRYLSGMVQHGILQLRYPDKPNRVDQAYQTTNPLNNIQK